ncbi:MAG: fibro-slime domain-containing protein [Clostridia bacterium]|nr:fibro-slime domain-containing protein [Clostridia bacterium]
MKNNILLPGHLFPKTKPKRRFEILFCLLACATFFFTCYALIMPAVTLGNNNSGQRAVASAEVWFDGTQGQGITVNYYPGATNVHITASGGIVVLPTTAGNPVRYQLNGWYDITSGEYYGREMLGQEITVNQDTVFYADWILKSYDCLNTGRTLADTIDTSSFVKTELFDYNELLNLLSGRTTSASISARNHSETWSFDANKNNGFNFAFHQWAYFEAGGNLDGRIGALRDRNDRNMYHSNDDTRLELGIVHSESDDIIQTLFTDSGTPGVKMVGGGTHLYQYDRETGYYYYDSSKNGASYQASEGRFYVYSDPTYLQGQQLRNNQWTNSSDHSTSFMPLNGENTVNEKDGEGDFWFGMKNTIDFFLPEVPGTNNGNCNYSTTGQPMQFRFSGDDDMWIFIDGELVLDLGGIHGIVTGTIDFSNGTVTRNGTTFPLPASIREGEHTLTMYYVERGSSRSNCSIYFNICPRYTLDLTKTDADSQQLLDGAEFTVYIDEDSTIPAMLYTSKTAYDNGENASNAFTVVNGRLECWGLSAGRTYYIRETQPPANGYADVSDAVMVLTLDSQGNPSVTVIDPTNTLSVSEVSRDSEIQHIKITVTNKKQQSTHILAKKVWLDETGNVSTEGEPIQLQLYRSIKQNQSTDAHNVYVTTQYFSQNPPYGSNSDADPVISGDYMHVIPVSDGSDLCIKLFSRAERAGFYSVTADGITISPKDSVMGNENCYMGGSWGHYPIQSADYTLTNINADRHVVITMIGFPNWENNNVSIDKNITVNYSQTNHDNGGSQTVSATVKPDDAVPVGNPVTVVAGEDGSWEYEWDELPIGDENNNYYYYIEETHLDGYETTYSGNGARWGTITVTNRKKDLGGICLILLKKSAIDNDMPLSGAKFDIYRPAGEGETGIILQGVDGQFVKVNNSPVTTKQNGRAGFGGLEEGTYYLVETVAPTGYILDSTPHKIELSSTAAVTDQNDAVITGSFSEPFVVITNEPKNTQGFLVVEKYWFKHIDGGSTVVPDDPSDEGISFRLYRKYEAAVNAVPITMKGKHSNDQGGTVILQDCAVSGTTFRFYVYGVWGNNSPDNTNNFTVKCTGGTVQKLNQTHTTKWSWYNAPVYEVSIPDNSLGVTIDIESQQWYDHYESDFVAGHEPKKPIGSAAIEEEIVSVHGNSVFTLNNANNWQMVFNREDLNEISGTEYTYWVEEMSSPDGYEATYRTEPSGIGEQIYLMIDNTKIYNEYELPKTGGKGIFRFKLGGALLVVCALSFCFYRTRRIRKEKKANTLS